MLCLTFIFHCTSSLSVTGAKVGAGLWAGLVAGLQVGQVYGVFYLPGFGLADYQPPGSWAPNLHLRHGH